jgi:uncharacterized protein (TIGR02285 family)
VIRGAAVAAGLSGMLALLPAVVGAEPLRMVYRDKPPYSYLENGVPKGFLLERTQKILARARIEAKFEILPHKRIFQDIQANAEQVCSFGWYKIPEREKYARFSVPMHQDRPHVVLASPRFARVIKRYKTLKSVMADASQVLAVIDGLSYGPELDAMIAGFPGTVDKSLMSPLQVAKKIAVNRADLMFIDRDDYDYLMETNAEFKNAGVVRVSFSDMPVGLKRYIICSQKVSEEVMRKINAAITSTR